MQIPYESHKVPLNPILPLLWLLKSNQPFFLGCWVPIRPPLFSTCHKPYWWMVWTAAVEDPVHGAWDWCLQGWLKYPYFKLSGSMQRPLVSAENSGKETLVDPTSLSSLSCSSLFNAILRVNWVKCTVIGGKASTWPDAKPNLESERSTVSESPWIGLPWVN